MTLYLENHKSNKAEIFRTCSQVSCAPIIKFSRNFVVRFSRKKFTKNMQYTRCLNCVWNTFLWKFDDKIFWNFQDWCIEPSWRFSEIFNKFCCQVLEKKICKKIQLFHIQILHKIIDCFFVDLFLENLSTEFLQNFGINAQSLYKDVLKFSTNSVIILLGRNLQIHECFYSPHRQGEWKHCGSGVLNRFRVYQLVKMIFHFDRTDRDTTFKTKTTTLQCCPTEKHMFKVEKVFPFTPFDGICENSKRMIRLHKRPC